ncbi:hypothetical protein QJQ45_009740 [Haematococcus lacustris]|nr:hypothetical protein QJQ45_009740 [Haematococcus lacustris]
MQLEEKADNVTQRLWGAHKQLFVFFGDAGIGTQGGWGATAVLQACRKAPPWGSWLDRDTNGCLNFQNIGESMQRPLELCNWDDLEALPPIGEEYQQRFKLVNDRLPKGRQRLHRAAEYRRGY